MSDIAEFDTPEGKVRLEVECKCTEFRKKCAHKIECIECPAYLFGIGYRPMTKQELDRYTPMQIKAMLSGILELTYKGQRVRVEK